MRALEFTNNLREAILELGSNPENHILFSEFDLSLFQKVKSFSIKFLKENEELINASRNNHFLIDLLNRTNFKNRINYALIKLNEYEIGKEEYYFYITKGISHFLREKDNYLDTIFNYKGNKGNLSAEDLVIMDIGNCFSNWYFPRDEYYIKFLNDRQLIYKDSLKKSWYISNLGSYFIKLTTFDAISFLCGIEVVMNSDKSYSKFINLEAINELLQDNEGNEYKDWYVDKRSNVSSYTLRALGIIENSYPNNGVVTNFGKKVLIKVKKELEEYNALILFLLESEASGINFSGLETEPELDKWHHSSYVLNNDQKKSIDNALLMYKQSNHLDSLRIIYPLLEGALDSALHEIKIEPSSLKGMQNKVEKLKKEKVISSKTSTGIEIFTSRNKILHGNIIEEDSETLKPLFVMVIGYLKKIVGEIETNLESMKTGYNRA